ncbi:MAG: hypothetical protein M1570_01415 [Chloroflexi bacterium]|nr:hypothetical protein [Chloroflexota bacterium]
MSSPNIIQFPDQLVIRVIEEETGAPVPGIVTTLTLYAKRKNNYDFGPKLSDSAGLITISREWVARSIEETMDFFIMDYSSRLEDCLPYVDVRVDSQEDILKEISARSAHPSIKLGELGISNTATELGKARNAAYEPQVVRIALDTPGEALRKVVIEVRRRGQKEE